MKVAAAPTLAINGDTMTDVKNITNFQAELKKPEDKFEDSDFYLSDRDINCKIYSVATFVVIVLKRNVTHSM